MVNKYLKQFRPTHNCIHIFKTEHIFLNIIKKSVKYKNKNKCYSTKSNCLQNMKQGLKFLVIFTSFDDQLIKQNNRNFKSA